MMTSTAQAALIAKLQKLKAKADDPSVTEAEASLYASKVAELLQQYNLSEAALDVQEEVQEVGEDRLLNSWTNNPWTHEIAAGVAQLYFCSTYLMPNPRMQQTKIVFVGKPHNVLLAMQMTDYLIKTVTRMALAYAKSPEAKREWDWTPVKSRNGFQRGAARRLWIRLNRLYQDQTTPEPVRNERGNPSNLPALYQDEKKGVEIYLEKMKLRPNKGKGSSASGGHALAGARAAESISQPADLQGCVCQYDRKQIMNAERRKALTDVIAKLEEAKNDLENIRNEEEDYKNNMPENMQSGEKGERADNAITAMEQADSEIESAISSIQEAIDA